MSVDALIDPNSRVEPRRNRNGWYLMTPPGGGEEKAYQRVTKLAETIDDRYNLEKWMQRQVAIGLTVDSSLLAAVAGAAPEAHTAAGRTRLNVLCEQAKDKAGTDKARRGTEIHRLTERHDRGETGFTVIDGMRGDLDAYIAGTAELTFTHIEAVVLCETLGYAGTVDRIGHVPGVGTCIIDLKSGSTLDFSMLAIAQQLGVYAHAETIWDPATETHSPMPEVRQDCAVVIHLPAGEATCRLVVVDIERGWQAARTSHEVRGWRAQAKTFGRPFTIPDNLFTAPAEDAATPASECDRSERVTKADQQARDLEAAWIWETVDLIADLSNGRATAFDELTSDELHALDEEWLYWQSDANLDLRRTEWIRRRIRYLGEHHPDVLPTVKERWPDGVPFPKAGVILDDGQADLIAAFLDRAETATSGEWCVDPKKSRTLLRSIVAKRAGGDVEPVDVIANIIERLEQLPPDLLAEATSKTRMAPGPVPHLRRHADQVTDVHVEHLYSILADVEATWRLRRRSALALLDSIGGNEADVLDLVSGGQCDSVERLSPEDMDRLIAVAAAVAEKLIDPKTLRTTTRVAAVLLDRLTREEAEALAARAWPDVADVPRLSFSSLCGDPVGAAFAAAYHQHNKDNRKDLSA